MRVRNAVVPVCVNLGKTRTKVRPFRRIFFPRLESSIGPKPSRGFQITLRHTTLGVIALDEWSVLRRDLWLTTHNTYKEQISTPPAGIEPTISANERLQTRSLARSPGSAVYKSNRKLNIWVFMQTLSNTMYGVQTSNIVTCLAVSQHQVCWLIFLNAILASANCNTHTAVYLSWKSNSCPQEMNEWIIMELMQWYDIQWSNFLIPALVSACR
jgi:hypothetical protein